MQYFRVTKLNTFNMTFVLCVNSRIKTLNLLKKNTPIKVGLKIREIRLQQKLTQIELANKINSDRQYLYKIETGKVGVSVIKLAIIAKALNVNICEFTKGLD